MGSHLLLRSVTQAELRMSVRGSPDQCDRTLFYFDRTIDQFRSYVIRVGTAVLLHAFYGAVPAPADIGRVEDLLPPAVIDPEFQSFHGGADHA